MSRWFRFLAPWVAVAMVLGAGTLAGAKVIKGKSIKNGTVTERKLSPAVRTKLNAPGPQGPAGPQGVPGPQGAPGNPAPAGRTASAQTSAISPIDLDRTAEILALSPPQGSGLLNVDGPARLLITAQVNAFKTAANFSKTSRLACTLLHEDVVGREAVGRRVEATMNPLAASGQVAVSLSLVGSVDVAAGAHDVSIQCSVLDSPPSNAGVSFFSASVNVDAVPR